MGITRYTTRTLHESPSIYRSIALSIALSIDLSLSLSIYRHAPPTRCTVARRRGPPSPTAR